MLSVGIDVSKGESMVCALNQFGKVVLTPRRYKHVKSALGSLVERLRSFEDNDIRIIMEATGIYSLPVAKYFKEQGFFVAVINPYAMSRFRIGGQGSLRNVKTDKADSMTIAGYGRQCWDTLMEYNPAAETYWKLDYLLRLYQKILAYRVSILQELYGIIEQTMPGIKEIGIKSPQVSTAKDILLDFAKTFWHYDQITGMSEKKFISRYLVWAKKKGHRPDVGKAAAIYAMAKDGIPCLPADPIVKQSIHTNIEALERVGTTLRDILSQMSGLAKTLPEYDIVRAMGGVGDVLVVKLIAVIGDIKRFRKAKSLVAYAGIDPPPYSSGKFEGNKRRISKRGSTLLRKIGYEIMKSLTRNKRPEDGAVYDFIRKKEEEGKAKKQAKIAGLNKFLQIYYARVKSIYKKTTEGKAA